MKPKAWWNGISTWGVHLFKAAEHPKWICANRLAGTFSFIAHLFLFHLARLQPIWNALAFLLNSFWGTQALEVQRPAQNVSLSKAAKEICFPHLHSMPQSWLVRFYFSTDYRTESPLYLPFADSIKECKGSILVPGYLLQAALWHKC